MNYQNIHNSIIQRASCRSKILDVVYESHHIIPRCEGGQSDGHQVWLTQKEHRIVHKLRFKLNGVLGNILAYNLMKYGRSVLAENHKLFSAAGGYAHHKQYRDKDPQGYADRQRRSGIIAGINSRDNRLGFHRLSYEEMTIARNKGRRTTTQNKLGMFSDKFRKTHKIKLQKQITTPDGIFDSMQLAAQYYGVVSGTVTYRVKSTSPQWSNWNYIIGDLHE
jgi:hypothetical protein